MNKKIYIPVEVNQKNKTKKWYLDVSNLSIEELITLKDELNGLSINCLDAIIYDKTCSSTFMYQMYNERKQIGKRNIQKKIKRKK